MDKIQDIYNLYLSKGLITDKTSLDSFRSANTEQQQKLYDLGKNNNLFAKTDISQFQTAWSVKKKDDTISNSQNSVLATSQNQDKLSSESTQNIGNSDLSKTDNRGQLIKDIDAGKFNQQISEFKESENAEKQRVDSLVSDFENKVQLTEQDLIEIQEEENEEDNGDFGFLENIGNKIRTTSAVSIGGSVVPNPFFNPTKAFNNPEKQQIRQELAIAKEIKPNEVDSGEVDEIFNKQRRQRLIENKKSLKTEEFIENISDEDKNTLTKEFRYDFSNLQIENKKILLETENIGSQIENKTNQLQEIIATHDKSKQYSNDYYERNNTLAKEIDSLFKSYEGNLETINKNDSDLGKLENEIDLFKRNYSKFYNFKEKAINSFATLGANGIHFINEGVNEIKKSTGIQIPIDTIIYNQVRESVDSVRENVKESEEGLTRRQALSDIQGITDVEGITEWALDVLAEQTANTTVLLATGGTSGLVTLGVSSAGAKLNELEEEEKASLGSIKYSNLEKWTVATISGVLEGVTEKISLGQINKGLRVLKSVPFKDIKSGVGSYLRNNAFKDLKSYAKDVSEETIGEVINDLGSKYSEEIFLGKDVNYTEGLNETIMSSVFMSGLVYKAPQIGVKVRNVFTTKDDNQKIAENTQTILKLTEQINKAQTEQVKSALESQRTKLAESNLSLIDKSIDNLDNLSNEDKESLININNEIFSLRQDYKSIIEDNGVDAETKEGLIKGLNDRRTQLENSKDNIINNESNSESTLEDSTREFAETLGEQEDVSRIVKGATKLNIDGSDIVLRNDGETIVIESIQTPKESRGKGIGRNALTKITEQADVQGKELSLIVAPLDEVTDPQKLVDFYASVGFEKTEGFELDGGKMVRKPKESSSNTEFNPLNSEGEALSKLNKEVESGKSIDQVAKEHTDSYTEYLFSQNPSQEVVNSDFVQNFENRIKEALTNNKEIVENQERSLENGSRIDNEGNQISETEFLKIKGDIKVEPTIEEASDFDSIDSIIKKSTTPLVVETNLNNYEVSVVDGALNIVPKLGKKRPSKAEVKKIEQDYIDKTDFNTGEIADFNGRIDATPQQQSEIVANESQNAVEVANEIQKVKSRNSENKTNIESTIESSIADVLSNTAVNDSNNDLTDLNRSYGKGRGKNSIDTIDGIREKAESLLGQDVSYADVLRFLGKYESVNQFKEQNNLDENKESTFELEEKFKEITGLKATEKNINAIAESQETQPQQETEANENSEDSEVPFQTESSQTRIEGKELNSLVTRLLQTGLAKTVKILGDNQISNFLENLGIENINDEVQLSKKGVTVTPNGFVYQDFVYLNREKVKTDTPIHEFGHLWNAYIKENNPEVYKRGLGLIENSEYHEQVKSNPAYDHLSEEGKLEEALAQAIGEKGVKILNESKKSKFNAWFKNLFSRIAKGLGLRNLNGNQLSKLTLDKFTDLASAELLSGKLIGHYTRPKTPRNKIKDSNVSNIDIVVSEQTAIKETKEKLQQKFRDNNVFKDDVRKELVKYIQQNLDTTRVNELQKSELNKLLNSVKRAKTKKNLLDSFNKVNDIVLAIDNRNLVKKINSILGKRFSKRESGRRKANITDEQTENLLNQVDDNINLHKIDDSSLEERRDEKLVELYDKQQSLLEKENQTEQDFIDLEATNISIDMLNALMTSDLNNANELLNQVLADVDSIFEDGRSNLKQLREARDIQDEAIINSLEDDANPEEKTTTKNVNVLEKEIKNKGNSINRVFHYWFRGRVTASLDAIATIISKKGGDSRDSSSWVQFVNRMKRQETIKKARIRKFADKWKKTQIEIFGSVKASDKLLNKKVDIEVEILPENETEDVDTSRTFTYSELLNVWQNYKNPDLRAGLASSGFTDAVLEQIDEILPQKVKDYGIELFDLYEQLYEDSNRVYKSLNFHSLGKPPFYAGKVNREGVSLQEDTDALLGGNMRINTTGYGSQKERVQNNNPINAIDVNGLFNRALQESSHYVAFAEVHRVYNKVLKNPRIRKAILLNNSNNGDQILKSLLYYKVRDLEQGGERGNKVVDAFGRNIARAILGLKAKIGITQTISIINGSFELPTNLNISQFKDAYVEGFKNIKYLMNNSQYLQNRYDIGGLENAVLGLDSLSKENAFKFNNSNLEAERKAIARAYKKATDIMLSNVKYGDMVGVLGSAPVYTSWKAKYLRDGLTEEQAESKAMEKFESSVDRAQQSISAFGKSQLQKDPYLRYLMMFATAPIQNLQNANYHRRELTKALRGKDYKGTNTRNALAFLNYQFAQPMLYTYISSIMAGSIMSALGFGEEEPDDEDKALLSSAILGNVQSVPAIGGILLYIIDKAVLDKEFTFANIIGSPLYDEIKKVERHIKNAVEAKKDDNRKDEIYNAIKKTGGILGGIPNFSFDIFEDLDDVYWNEKVGLDSKIYRALGYSKIVVENKTDDKLKAKKEKKRLTREEAKEKREQNRENRKTRE